MCSSREWKDFTGFTAWPESWGKQMEHPEVLACPFCHQWSSLPLKITLLKSQLGALHALSQSVLTNPGRYVETEAKGGSATCQRSHRVFASELCFTLRCPAHSPALHQRATLTHQHPFPCRCSAARVRRADSYGFLDFPLLPRAFPSPTPTTGVWHRIYLKSHSVNIR